MTETERLLIVASRERARTQFGRFKAERRGRAATIGVQEIDRKVYWLDDGPRTVVTEFFERDGKEIIRLRLEGSDSAYEFRASRWFVGEPLGYAVLVVLCLAVVLVAFVPGLQRLLPHAGH